MQTSKLTYTYIPPKFIADRWTAEGEDSVAKHIQSTMIPLQHVRTLRRQFEQDRKRIITEPVFKVSFFFYQVILPCYFAQLFIAISIYYSLLR